MIGKILLWLQEHIKLWMKPSTSVLIIGILSDLTRSRTDLVVENALLRQQLIVLKRQCKRPRLSNHDRFRLVFLSHITKFWKQAIHIVQPDTLLRWHRELFQFYWRWKSQGKPKITPEAITLIQEISKENLLWGAERMRGELLNLGIEVSKRTIQRYMPEDRKRVKVYKVRRRQAQKNYQSKNGFLIPTTLLKILGSWSYNQYNSPINHNATD